MTPTLCIPEYAKFLANPARFICSLEITSISFPVMPGPSLFTVSACANITSSIYRFISSGNFPSPKGLPIAPWYPSYRGAKVATTRSPACNSRKVVLDRIGDVFTGPELIINSIPNPSDPIFLIAYSASAASALSDIPSLKLLYTVSIPWSAILYA